MMDIPKQENVPVVLGCEDDTPVVVCENKGTLTLDLIPTDNQTNQIATLKTKCEADIWIECTQTLSLNGSKVARYNPTTKAFRCVECDLTGYLSRIAEHYLGMHTNEKVFHCPRCPYSSTWVRCVTTHLSRTHNENCAPSDVWKDIPLWEEITKLLQDLKDASDRKDKGDPPTDKKYVCEVCMYATDRGDLFTRHKYTHSAEKPFHCYACLKLFNRPDHVKKHFLRIHRELPYDSTRIRRLMPETSRTALKQKDGIANEDNKNGTVSVNKRDPQKLIPCPYCSFLAVDNWYLRRHLNTHIKPYLCLLCDYKAARGEHFVKHMRKIHGRYACTKCRFVAMDESMLDNHRREQHHVGVPFQCEDCGETFMTRNLLDKHYASVHHKKVHLCSECGFQTSTAYLLKLHRSRHKIKIADNSVNQFSISAALNNEFVTRYFPYLNLNNNGTADILLHPYNNITFLSNDFLINQPQPRVFKCEFCSFGAWDLNAFERHKRMHMFEIHYCKECSHEFNNSLDLQSHISHMHGNNEQKPEQMYKCSLCTFSCDTRYSMIEHMRIHTGELYECSIKDCAYKTPYHSAMKRHKETAHAAIKFKCPFCSRSFQCTDSLNCHLKRKKQQSSCKKCDLRFCNDCSLLLHLKRKHSKKKMRKVIKKNGIRKKFPKYMYKCRQCQPPRKFVFRKNYILHSLNHITSFLCETCSVHYSHRYQLKLHKHFQNSSPYPISNTTPPSQLICQNSGNFAIKPLNSTNAEVLKFPPRFDFHLDRRLELQKLPHVIQSEKRIASVIENLRLQRNFRMRAEGIVENPGALVNLH